MDLNTDFDNELFRLYNVTIPVYKYLRNIAIWVQALLRISIQTDQTSVPYSPNLLIIDPHEEEYVLKHLLNELQERSGKSGNIFVYQFSECFEISV